MDTEQINYINYTLHVVLLITKLLIVIKFYNWFIQNKTLENKKSMLIYSKIDLSLFIFCVIMLSMEIVFLYNFSSNLDLYYYEFLSIIDQIIFSIIAIKLYTKE